MVGASLLLQLNVVAVGPSTTGRQATNSDTTRRSFLAPLRQWPGCIAAGRRPSAVGVGASPWHRLEVTAETATKKKPGKKPQSKNSLPLPGPYQQTLKRSFTVGGLGLHTGEYVFLRVRPAYAGEGRYFVRVPEGSNSWRFEQQEELKIDLQQYGEDEGALDRDEEAFKVQLFSEYLAAEEEGTFTGSFLSYLEKEHNVRVATEQAAELAAAAEEPVQPRGENEPHIPACIDYAVDDLAIFTGLRNGELQVAGVESLLSALEACGVDNARIEMEGGHEVPVLDGSALGWCIEVAKAGLRLATYAERDKIRKVAWAPKEVITVREGDAFVQLIPESKQRITCGIDHSEEAEVVGKQWHTWCPSDDEEHYRWEVAPARTFAPSVQSLHDLRSQGLLCGGTSDVALLADGDRWYDHTMVRFFDDEPVRHKVADLLGDLSLMGIGGCAGMPIGHVISYKADHALQIRFVKALRQLCTDDNLMPVG